MLPIHQRLAELWTINLRRDLSQKELEEMEHCLRQNAARVWEVIKLKNLSEAAYIADDVDWQHDICAQMERLKESNNANNIL
ncbi:hypothetical protein [Paenibacillus phage SV21]|nr:hypothetical protein [Paenibacillus phage SV21]